MRTADAGSTASPDRDVASALIDLIQSDAGKGRVTLSGAQRTAVGFSRENWTFDATISTVEGDEILPLILRRDPESSLLETEREHEIAVLRALESTDIPAPRVLWADPTGARFGRPTIVMWREAGDCDWWVLNGSAPIDERVSLADQFIELLATVQSVPATALSGSLADPGPNAAEHELEMWRATLEQNALEPHPELALAHRWLRERLFTSSERVLVHGDFKPGNILLDRSHPPILLDWETAHLGDPLEDLGGITNPVRAKEQLIRGAWQRADIIASYEKHTGRTVDRAQLLWWNVLANYKLATIVLTGVRSWITGRFDRIMQPPTGLYRKMFDLMASDPKAL